MIRPLRIVHAIARLNVGGAARNVIELAAEQRSRGHDVLVVAGRIARGEDSMEYLADQLAVPVRRLPALRREVSPAHDLAATAELRSVVRAVHPHVLHTHTSKAGATGRLAALLCGRGRPPVVVHTYHGHVLRGYFDAGRERAFRTIERALAPHATALLAVSPEVRDDLVAIGVADATRFAVVRYGFDLAPVPDPEEARRALREEVGAGEGAFVVGFAGRLTAIKRPLDLVRTLHALREDGVDGLLVVVGDGPDREPVERLAAELGVADRCRLLGFRPDMRRLYPGFDALLLASANEGTPVVAIEALAAGLPVVATDVGGTASVVREGVSGFLAPAGDVAALAGRLAELARRPRLRARLGAAGAADMRARFATERMADDVDRLYEALLGR